MKTWLLRPSDQRKRSLGHDLTSLRTQRRPSFSGSLGALRSKVNITHRASSIVESHPEIIEERIERQSRVSLSYLFLSLPGELQAQIIAPLPIHTILDLRQVSRSFHQLVTTNEAPIARYHAKNTLPLIPYDYILYQTLPILTCIIWVEYGIDYMLHPNYQQ
ncbi:hypothetical protein DID88_003963 [Monilinia fructigena]|uniref:F-box domain-containing protein n=1 Tax=Monilinia fructigena TaxID=38457 RepID=A0A395IH05_9HELO|nr:hypothetical protein DID88_003963 [Monilinia fructigena]